MTATDVPGALGYGDDLGPVKVVLVHEATLGLNGVLVVDNVAAGPSIGGVRMAPDVTTSECAHHRYRHHRTDR